MDSATQTLQISASSKEEKLPSEVEAINCSSIKAEKVHLEKFIQDTCHLLEHVCHR